MNDAIHDGFGSSSFGGDVGGSGASLELVSAYGGRLARVTLIAGNTYTIGRGVDCEIPIADHSLALRHVRLVVGDGVTIEDLGSETGTLVAGIDLAPHAPVPLHVGSVAEAGCVRLVLRRPASTCPPTSTRGGGGREGGTTARDAGRCLDATLEAIAPSRVPVLVTGEMGTGKGSVARQIHARSDRAGGPFVIVRCADEWDEDLFGVESPDPCASRPGLLEAAHGGTLFFEDVGRLSPGTQLKLLRALETGDVLRLGSMRARRVNLRVVASTHLDLPMLVVANLFRPDLYYRLNGFTLHLPPLRHRPSGIVSIALQMIEQQAHAAGRPAPRLSSSAAITLGRHTWPGNGSELRRVIARALGGCDDEILSSHLSFEGHAPAHSRSLAFHEGL